ncbi:helix-turn-helix domain-containing protein [Streptomyces mauvecolor]
MTSTLGELAGEGTHAVNIKGKLRIAAAQREVWTGAQLRRLLAEKAGLELSCASVSALFTKEPSQVKMSTLAALCTELECTPNDLIEVDTTPVEHPALPPRPAADPPRVASARGRSMPPI